MKRITPSGLRTTGPLVSRLYEKGGIAGYREITRFGAWGIPERVSAYPNRAFTKSEMRGYVYTSMHKTLGVAELDTAGEHPPLFVYSCFGTSLLVPSRRSTPPGDDLHPPWLASSRVRGGFGALQERRCVRARNESASGPLLP